MPLELPAFVQGVILVAVYMQVAELLMAVLLIVLILLQARGAGFSGTFNTEATVFRTRRGLEKTLFNTTIVVAVLFLLLTIGSVILSKPGLG